MRITWEEEGGELERNEGGDTHMYTDDKEGRVPFRRGDLDCDEIT